MLFCVGSNGLITGLIKWAKLDRSGFGVKYIRLWFLCGLGWDGVSWLEMGLERGKMYHPLTWARIL